MIPVIHLIRALRQSTKFYPTADGRHSSIFHGRCLLKKKSASAITSYPHISHPSFQISTSKILFRMKIARHYSVQILDNSSMTFEMFDPDAYPEDKPPPPKDKKKSSRHSSDVRFLLNNELIDRQSNHGISSLVTLRLNQSGW